MSAGAVKPTNTRATTPVQLVMGVCMCLYMLRTCGAADHAQTAARARCLVGSCCCLQAELGCSSCDLISQHRPQTGITPDGVEDLLNRGMLVLERPAVVMDDTISTLCAIFSADPQLTQSPPPPPSSSYSSSHNLSKIGMHTSYTRYAVGASE